MRKLLLILGILLCFTVGGVYATWKYAGFSPKSTEDKLPVALNLFDFPEHVLPGGGEVEKEEGHNHYGLIELILNTSDYALNKGASQLPNYLEQNKYLHCNQKTSGMNVKFVLNPTKVPETGNLYYCLEYVSENKFYCYTFDMEELESQIGTEIVVYRTALEKINGKWDDTTSVKGYATAEELGEGALSNISAYPQYDVKCSIDVANWHSATEHEAE